MINLLIIPALLYTHHSMSSWYLINVNSRAKLSLCSFASMPTLMLVHVHFDTLNVWLMIWICSSKVKAMLLAASVSFLSPEILNLNRNSNRNKTNTCYKAIIPALVNRLYYVLTSQVELPTQHILYYMIKFL